MYYCPIVQGWVGKRVKAEMTIPPDLDKPTSVPNVSHETPQLGLGRYVDDELKRANQTIRGTKAGEGN
jgi:hypothetical protein